MFLLDFGHGRVVTVEPDTGSIDTIAELLGYTRDLAIHERYGFVGLSRVREKSQFGGLPVEDRVDQMQCAVYVIDLLTGQVTGFLVFESGCSELFDAQVLAGIRGPAVVGFQKETIDEFCIVPLGGASQDRRLRTAGESPKNKEYQCDMAHFAMDRYL